MIEQIILQSSSPDSIVMDCFAGSGSALKCAEKLGRKWVGIDNSDIAIDVIRSNDLGAYQYIEI